MSWIEVEIERDHQAVLASARGARGERVAPYDLAPINLGRLSGLGSGVRRAVASSQELPDHVVVNARELYAALFRDQLRDLVVREGEAARAKGRRLLLRLMIRDPELQRFPWEAMCRPETARDFVGCLPDLLVSRGVNSNEPHEAREIRHATRILVIAPLGEEEKIASLKSALHESIAEGAIQWLPPIVGAETIGPRLFERLRRVEEPHVIHWIGHGGADERQNPCLYLAEDADGETSFILAETLAQELKTSIGAELRLIVLEACSGARPGAFASAAEILARSGADAVVAHLWPVKAEVARDLSATFYRTLTGSRDGVGDVAASLQATRRTFIERGAEAFSPVLYLRGADPRLLDFKRRRLIAPTQARGGWPRVTSIRCCSRCCVSPSRWCSEAAAAGRSPATPS
ncbi:MAG: CHAT domain-containing protein [Nannocystis sp.]|nr:CHAT domain-containing protein [Nannocystis sp.]